MYGGEDRFLQNEMRKQSQYILKRKLCKRKDQMKTYSVA